MKKALKILKKLIPVLVIAAIVGTAAYIMLKPQPMAIVGLRTGTASVMDLRNAIDVTGAVQSDDVTNVYAPLTQPILEVLAEVGDYVEEGDLLCRLDSSSIESNITTTQSNMYNSQRSSNISLEQAQRDLEKAQSDLERAVAELDYDQNQTILAQQYSVEGAERTLRDATTKLRDAENDYYELQNRAWSGEEVSDQDLKSKRSAIDSAWSSVNSAQAAYDEAKRKLDRTIMEENENISELEAKVKSAQEKVDSAKISGDQTSSYINLENLKKDLEKCEMKAPVSGTITSVNAIKGATASGLMFVIQDTDELVITTSIKEYDIGIVQIGQKVEIKTNATGDDVYEGELIHIDPASSNTGSGTTAEFGAKVRVTSKEHRLLIGMNARMSIITEEKLGVLSIPYDALAESMVPGGFSGPPEGGSGIPGEGMRGAEGQSDADAPPANQINLPMSGDAPGDDGDTDAPDGDGDTDAPGGDGDTDAPDGDGDTDAPNTGTDAPGGEFQDRMPRGNNQDRMPAGGEAAGLQGAQIGFGGMVVYVARQQEDGTYIAEMVPVTLGMETDIYVEVIGDIKEGDIVILEHTGLTDGAPVTLDFEVGFSAGMAGGSNRSGMGGIGGMGGMTGARPSGGGGGTQTVRIG